MNHLFIIKKIIITHSKHWRKLWFFDATHSLNGWLNYFLLATDCWFQMIVLFNGSARRASGDLNITLATHICSWDDNTDVTLLVIKSLPCIRWLQSICIVLNLVVCLDRSELWIVISIKKATISCWPLFGYLFLGSIYFVPLLNVFTPDLSLVVVDTSTAIHEWHCSIFWN